MADFNFQPIVQSYTPPPVAEFDAFGKVLADRYNTNLANMDNLEIFASQINTLEGSRQIKDKAIADIRGLLDEYKKRGDYENSAPKIRLAAKRLATDKNLAQAMENFENAKKWDEEVRQARVQGIDMLQFGDYRNERFDEEGNLMTNLPQADNQRRLDWEARQASYFDQLQASSSSVEESGYRLGENGLWENYGTANQEAGISAQRVMQQAQMNLDNYLQSSEGKQQMKYLTHKNYGNMSKDDAKQRILNGLVTTGMERVFSNTATKTARSYMPNPYTQEALQNEQLIGARLSNEGRRLSNAAARMQMSASQGGGMSSSDFLQAYKSESFNTSGGMTEDVSKEDISTIVNKIATGKGKESSMAESVFLRNLEALSRGEGKEAKQAKTYLNTYNAMRRAMPNSYKQLLPAMEGLRSGTGLFSKGTTKDVINQLANESPAFANLVKTNPTQAENLAKSMKGTVDLTRSQSSAILGNSLGENDWSSNPARRRTGLEKAFKDMGASYELEFVSPNMLTLPTEMRTQWNAFKDDPIINPSNLDYIGGADKDKMTGKLEVVGISSGRYPGAQGYALEVRNSKGDTFVVNPKSQKINTAITNFMGDSRMIEVHNMTAFPEQYKNYVNNLQGLASGQLKVQGRVPSQAERKAATDELMKISSVLFQTPELQYDEAMKRRIATPKNGVIVDAEAMKQIIDKIGGL